MATLASCGTRGAELERQYADLIKQAEYEVRLAAYTGFIWSDTEATLAQAKAAHETGDLAQAIRLAQIARDEAIQAQLQARAAAKARPDYGTSDKTGERHR